MRKVVPAALFAVSIRLATLTASPIVGSPGQSPAAWQAPAPWRCVGRSARARPGSTRGRWSSAPAHHRRGYAGCRHAGTPGESFRLAVSQAPARQAGRRCVSCEHSTTQRESLATTQCHNFGSAAHPRYCCSRNCFSTTALLCCVSLASYLCNLCLWSERRLASLAAAAPLYTRLSAPPP